MQVFAVFLNASPDPNKPISDFIHQSWQTAQGLPQDSVLTLAQSGDGYLWIGTEEGLVRFDGVRFTVFDKHTSGLKGNMVEALLVDRHQNLWAGTAGGGLARLRNGRLTPVAMGDGLADKSVRCLYEDSGGAIWIGTDGGGLVRFQNGQFRVFTTLDGLADNMVFSITGDKDGSLWVATHSGVSRFRNGRFERLRLEGASSCEAARVAHTDRFGTLWLGTTDGLCRVSSNAVKRFTTKDGLTGNTIYSLFEDGSGTIWIGTANGLTRFANGTFSSFTEKDGLVGKEVWALFEDREGTLWVGTAGGGLNSLKNGSFSTLSKGQGLLSDTILPVYQSGRGQSDRGTIWIGSDQGLMAWKSGQVTSYTTREGLPDNLVFSVAPDRSGTLWIGTRRGLARLRDGRITPIDELPKNYVLCTFVDRKNELWTGSRAGLANFDGHTFKTYTTRDGLSNNNVLAVYEDKDGALWIGTGGGGINRFKDGQFKAYTTKDGLESNVVWAISGESDGTVWLGTNGGGLSRWRNGKITTVTTAQGLYDDSVLGIVDDHLGNLWMTSDKGVFKVRKRQLEDFANGLVKRVTPAVYGVADGMKTRECNGGFQPSVWRLDDGRLCFPTAKGLAIVNPAEPARSRIAAILEKVSIDKKEFSIDGPITVPPGKGQLEFTFTAPSFIDPQKIQFRYMLEGFDKDWTEAGTRRTAYYTNIPHGDYRFRVLAGSDGQWSTVGPRLGVTLQPHYYETAIFYLTSGLFFIGLCTGAYAMRVNQLKMREVRLLRLVDERTAALRKSEHQLRASRDELEIRVKERTQELVEANQTLTEEVSVRKRTQEQLTVAKEAAEAASRAKSDFLANISHEIRTPINGIIGMTELTLGTDLGSEPREYVELVKSSADSLLGIVNDILDFSAIENRKLALDKTEFNLRDSVKELVQSASLRARQKNLAFNSRILPTVPTELVGDPLRLRQVVSNLLDNAIKFTSKGSISLSIDCEQCSNGHASLHFVVQDTGIGISEAKQRTIFEAFAQADTSSTRKYGGTGLGLTISSRLVELMGGKLAVDSRPGEGSTFYFRAHFDRPKRVRRATEPSFQTKISAEVLA